ncbi:ribosome-associated translation inhibitor RaiA, partial [Actinomadura sp. KC06]|uniref:ribosome hibernation-promoting factor, HPF/YfiA family n=2 Tax=unclassified Actinomadura TaxID=2626254 RepID=UPI001046DDF5
MNITVRGRHTDVNDRFRRHVDNKLAKIERLDQKVIRVDVEVSEERNPRLADQRERVELTIRSRGPVIRAEAAADDRYGALDLALDKLESRLRRDSERRKGHGGKGRAKLATMETLPEALPEP